MFKYGTGVVLKVELDVKDRPIWGPELVRVKLDEDYMTTWSDTCTFNVKPENRNVMQIIRRLRYMGLNVKVEVIAW